MAPDSPPPAEEFPAELEQALAAFLDAESRDAPLDRKRLLAEYPQWREELAAFFADHDRLRQTAGSWRGGGDSQPTILHVPSSCSSLDATLVASAPIVFGDYELLEKIAQGGMGIVYRARQRSLNRIVAVKMILQGQFSTPQERERFRVEAEAAAKLRHPHIVVVYELGSRDDQQFFSMEYVAGRSLAELLRSGGPLPANLAAHYVRQAALALAYAHGHGVLHRDVKPSNILIDDSGDARVMDFGLAKRIDRQEGLTLTGELVGTPAYMAPEQISADVGAVGPATDVYGLGAVLYQLLTGRPPFDEATQVETLLAALEDDPPLPRQLNPAVPAALELIALKCLEKKPSDRYASAEAVALDLERFLEGEPLSVSSPNRMERLVRALERSRFDREVYEASRFVAFSGWIALATHTLIFLAAWLAWSPGWAIVATTRAAEIGAMLAVFWPRRRDWFPPRGAAARQLWSMWLGYLTAATALVVVDYLQAPRGAPYYSLHAYPALAVLSSLAFWVLGSTYWGYCYLMGAFFLAAGLVMPLALPAGPLVFGLGWFACLTLLGRRLHQLAAKSAAPADETGVVAR